MTIKTKFNLGQKVWANVMQLPTGKRRPEEWYVATVFVEAFPKRKRDVIYDLAKEMPAPDDDAIYGEYIQTTEDKVYATEDEAWANVGRE